MCGALYFCVYFEAACLASQTSAPCPTYGRRVQIFSRLVTRQVTLRTDFVHDGSLTKKHWRDRVDGELVEREGKRKGRKNEEKRE